MSSGNGTASRKKAQKVVKATVSPDGQVTGATPEVQPRVPRPPAPRFPIEVMRKLAIAAAALPLALWVLLAYPRAREITGALNGSGNGSSGTLLVALMLAAISLIVSSLAVIVTTISHSEINDRVEVERAEAARLEPPKQEAEQAAVAAAEARNQAFGATDALVGTYSDALQAIQNHFWENHYRRHAEDPEVYGTWDDKDTLKERFQAEFDELFHRPEMLTPEDLKALIEKKRKERANFRNPQLQADE